MPKHRKSVQGNVSSSQLLNEKLREKQKSEHLQENWTNWAVASSSSSFFKTRDAKSIIRQKNIFTSDSHIIFDIQITSTNDLIFYNKNNIFNMNDKINPQLPLIDGIKYTFNLSHPTSIFYIKKTLFDGKDKNNENIQDPGNIFNNPLQGGTGNSLVIINVKSTFDTFFPQYQLINYSSSITDISATSSTKFDKKIISNFIVINPKHVLYPLQSDRYSLGTKFCDINVQHIPTGINNNYYTQILNCREKGDPEYSFNGGMNYKMDIIKTDESNNYKVLSNNVFMIKNKIEYDEDALSKMIMFSGDVPVHKGIHLKLPTTETTTILNTSNTDGFLPTYLRVLYENGHIIIKTNNWATFLNYYPVKNGVPKSKSIAIKISYPNKKKSSESQIFKSPFTNSETYRDNKGVIITPATPRPIQNFSYMLVGRNTRKLIHWFSYGGKPSEILLVESSISFIGGKLNHTRGNGKVYSSEYSDPNTFPNRFKKQVKRNMLFTPKMSNYSFRWDDSWIGTNNFNTFSLSRTIPTTEKYNWQNPGFQYKMVMGVYHSIDEDIFNLDSYGGSLNADNTYRINSPALFLEKNIDDEYIYSNCIIGYSLDGYPIMGPGSTNYPTQYFSSSVIAKSSYKLKTKSERHADDTQHYGGNPQYAYGLYVADWIYENGHGNLDEFNGGNIFIDGFERAYFMTDTYPFFPPFLNNEIDDIQTS